MRLDPTAIYTDAHGRPFERPERPGPDATPEERAAFVRAWYAYRDAITGSANRAFDAAFRAESRKCNHSARYRDPTGATRCAGCGKRL